MVNGVCTRDHFAWFLTGMVGPHTPDKMSLPHQFCQAPMQSDGGVPAHDPDPAATCTLDCFLTDGGGWVGGMV